MLLLPTWATIGFFLLLPVLLMLVYSFLTKEIRGGVIWDFTLAAYDQFVFDRGLFGDEPPKIEWTYIVIFVRSILQAGVATLLCLAIGFPTAYFIATRSAVTRSAWLFLITVPYWVNLLIRTVSMKFLIRDTGPLNEALLSLWLIGEPLALVKTNLAVQLGLFYFYLPFMVLPIYASVERYDFALSEAAADLYGGRWTILRRVLLPIVRPGIVRVASSSLCRAWGIPRTGPAGRRQDLLDRVPDRGAIQGKFWKLSLRRRSIHDSPDTRVAGAPCLRAAAGPREGRGQLKWIDGTMSGPIRASCR